MDFHHKSVLLKETIDNLNIKNTGIYVDGTLGGGGHAEEICKRITPPGLLIGIDQDKDAIEAARDRLSKYSDRVVLIHNNFSNINDVLNNLNIDAVDGVLLDLGVSSYQLDNENRGFSYMADAELDMRMNRESMITAKDIVNTYPEERLYEIIKEYGEEKWAKRIANFIVEERKKGEIKTTSQLVEIIKAAIPAKARRNGPHPAKRTFQAIRIEVNKELSILEDSIKNMVKRLNNGGRICIITFHSLEDRIVKNTFKILSQGCTCPPELPICQCNRVPSLKIITKKPIIPSEIEINENPRSRSAKLRVAERI